MVPLQGDGSGSIPEPVCANKVRNGLASADQGFFTASQGSCRMHGTVLSSKRIATNDNMRRGQSQMMPYGVIGG